MFDKAKVEVNQKTIEAMSHIKDIQYIWNFRSDYDIVSKYLPLLPARTKYNLLMNYFNLKTNRKLDEKLRTLNWNDKRIYSISCWEIQQLKVFNIIAKTNNLPKSVFM